MDPSKLNLNISQIVTINVSKRVWAKLFLIHLLLWKTVSYFFKYVSVTFRRNMCHNIICTLIAKIS